MATLKKDYPKIKFHIVSGDSEDLSEKLDKGILDFCIFIEPFVPDKYKYLNLRKKDTWGILLRQDDPLAKKKNVKINLYPIVLKDGTWKLDDLRRYANDK